MQQGLFVPISSCHFRQVFVNCWMSILKYAYKQVATFTKLSLGNSPLLPRFQKQKRLAERFPFITSNNWIVSNARRFGENAKRFAFQANGKNKIKNKVKINLKFHSKANGKWLFIWKFIANSIKKWNYISRFFAH